MSSLCRCARLCLSRINRLPRALVSHQTHRNATINILQPQALTVSFNSRRNFVQEAQKDEATSSHRSRNVWNPIDDLELVLYHNGNIQLHQILSCLRVFEINGIQNIEDGLKVLRCTGDPLCELHPEKRMKYTEETWKYIQESGIPLEISVYNNKLLVYLENKHKFSPPEYLAMMEKEGVAPNRVTYQLLLAAYCENGDIDHASQILEYMKSQEMATSSTVYNSLITGHFKANDVEGALNMVELMKKSDISPTSETYWSLLQGYAERGELESMKKVIYEADQKAPMTPFQFTGTMFTAVNNGHEFIAFELLEIMNQRNMKFFLDIKTVLCQMLCHGHADIAFKFSQDILKNDIYLMRSLIANFSPGYQDQLLHDYVSSCEPFTIYSLIKCAYLCQKPEWALTLFEWTKDSGIPCRPHMFLPAYLLYVKENNKEGILNILEYASRTITDEKFVARHLLDHIIPVLQSSGETIDEIFKDLRTRDLPKNEIDYAYFWMLVYSDPVKAVEFGKVNNINISLNKTFKGKLDMKEHWKEHFEIMAMCKKNDYKCGNLLEEALLQNRDDAEDILKYFSSLELPVTQLCIDSLKRNGLLDSVSAESVQELLISKRTGAPPTERVDVEELTHLSIGELESLIERKPTFMQAKYLLLQRYCFSEKKEEAEKLATDLERSIYRLPSMCVVTLLHLYADHERDLSNSLKYLTMMECDHPYFHGYKQVLTSICAALVDAGRYEDVMPHIQLYSERHGPVNKRKNTYAINRLASNLGQKVEPSEALSFFEELDRLSFLTAESTKTSFLRSLIKGYIIRGDPDMIVEVFTDIAEKHKIALQYQEIFSFFIEREDTDNLQKVLDSVHSVVGEANTLLTLMYTLVLQDKVPQARELIQSAKLHGRMDVIEMFCSRLIRNKQIKELENMVDVTKSIFKCDRDTMLYLLMKGYVGVGDFASAKNVLLKYEEEGILPSTRTLHYLSKELTANEIDVDFYVPKPVENNAPTAKTDKKSNTAVDSVEPPFYSVVLEKLATRSFKEYLPTLMESDDLKDIEERKKFCKWLHGQSRGGFKFLLEYFVKRGDVAILKLLKRDLQYQLNFEIAEAIANSNPATFIEELDLHTVNLDSHITYHTINTLHRTCPDTYNKVTDMILKSKAVKSPGIVWQHCFLTDPDRADIILQEASEDVKKNLWTTRIAFELVRQNKEDRLLKLLDIAREYDPTSIQKIYECILQLYSKVSDLEKAKQLLDKMEGEGYRRNSLDKVTKKSINRLLNEYNDDRIKEVSSSADTVDLDIKKALKSMQQKRILQYSTDLFDTDERYKDEEKRKQFCYQLLVKQKKRRGVIVIRNLLINRGDYAVVKYLTEDLELGNSTHVAAALANSKPTEIIEQLDLQIPENLNKYITTRVLCILEKRSPDTCAEVVDMMMRNSSKNDFSTVWQYYFIKDPEKAKKVLEEASDEMKEDLKVGECGIEMVQQKKEDRLLQLLDIAREYNPKAVKDVYEYMIQVYALEKDSEKATKLLESLKHEGIDLHKQSTRFTKTALTTLFREKGLELPEKPTVEDSLKSEENAGQSSSSSSHSDVGSSKTA